MDTESSVVKPAGKGDAGGGVRVGSGWRESKEGGREHTFNNKDKTLTKYM